MDKENQFLSVNNLKILLDVIEDFFRDKYNFTLPSNFNIKKLFYDVMRDIRAEFPLDDIKTLNKKTLQTVRAIVKEKLVKIKKELKNEEIETKETFVKQEPPQMLTESQPPVFFQERPMFDINNKTEQLMGDYEKLNNERISETKKEVMKNDNIKEDYDEPITEEDFKNKLNQLQNSRNIVEVPKDENNEKIIEKDKVEVEFNKLTSMTEPDHMPPDLYTDNNFMAKRNELISGVYKKKEEIEPKDLFNKLRLFDSIDGHYNVESRDIPFTDLRKELLAPKIKRDVELEKYVLINSFDRDWLTFPKRYQYRVKFTNTVPEIQTVNIYENNPTVPYTRTATSDGVSNTNGFYLDGVLYAAYNSGNPLGSIIGTEDLEFVTDQDANVQDTFRNITSISATKLILPDEIVQTGVSVKTKFNDNFSLSYPYVLLSFSEFRDVYRGTDDTIRKTFATFVYDSNFQAFNGRGYVVLCPIQDEKKVFFPSPLSSLSQLNVEIYKPNGELLNNSTDGFGILKIEYEAFNPNYLKIITTTYFDKNEFFVCDCIQIRSYVLFKVAATQDESLDAEFTNFINREQGHYVTLLGTANANGYYNTFYIQAPGSFNESTGAYEPNTTLIDNLCEFNTNYVLNSDANGFILNMSLQNAISLKITTRDYDATVVASENI